MNDPSSPRRPIVGIGAVIWNARNEVLLIRRARPPHRGEWSVPGGKVEWGETLHDALRREVREETGVEIEITGLAGVLDSFIPGEGAELAYHYVLVDYTARWKAGEARPASDVSEVAWAPYAALGRYQMWEEMRRFIEMSARQMGITAR